MKISIGSWRQNFFSIGTMKVRKPTARYDLWIIETWLVVAWKWKEKRFAKRIITIKRQVKHQVAIAIYEN